MRSIFALSLCISFVGACNCGSPNGGTDLDGSMNGDAAGDGSVPVGCGDGTLDSAAGELCDDGNVVAGDGCDPTCTIIAPGYNCYLPGMPCVRCGDGVRAQFEGCDDGNVANGDGCTSSCAVEPGYSCSLAGTCIASRCGDGVRAGLEECDDGNILSGDGCSISCRVDPGYTCPGNTCVMTVCGNGIKEGSEGCDDGNVANGDGCSSTCVKAAGYSCMPGALCQPTACVGTVDGVIQFPEACDDGNGTASDGCTACAIDAGWVCTVGASGSVCHQTTCGDGTIEGTEKCDDANTANTDGCSSVCQTEPLYTCPYDATLAKSVCRPIVQFVETRRWNVANLNPNAMFYDPTTRCWRAHRSAEFRAGRPSFWPRERVAARPSSRLERADSEVASRSGLLLARPVFLSA